MNQPVSASDLPAASEISESRREDPLPGDASAESRPAVDPASTSIPWSLLLAGCVLVVLVLNGLMPLAQPVIDTLGNFQWQGVLIATSLAVWQFFRRRPRWGVFLLLLTALPAFYLARLYLPVGQQPASSDPVIGVLTVNVLEDNTDYQAVLDLIRDVDPDIVNLIEYTDLWDREIREKMRAYPYRLGPHYGNIIYSKIPMVEDFKHHHAFDPWFSPGFGGVLWIGDERVYLWLIHTTSPTSAERLTSRDSQILGLQSAVSYRAENMHVIAAGDFNATTHCRSLDFLLKSTPLRDSRRGFGLQNSWPTWCWPLGICIDHVFVSPHVRVHQRRTERPVGSDHLPVYVELSFGKHPRRWPERTRQQHQAEAAKALAKALAKTRGSATTGPARDRE